MNFILLAMLNLVLGLVLTSCGSLSLIPGPSHRRVHLVLLFCWLWVCTVEEDGSRES